MSVDHQNHWDSSSGNHKPTYTISWQSITSLLRYLSLDHSNGPTNITSIQPKKILLSIWFSKLFDALNKMQTTNCFWPSMPTPTQYNQQGSWHGSDSPQQWLITKTESVLFPTGEELCNVLMQMPSVSFQNSFFSPRFSHMSLWLCVFICASLEVLKVYLIYWVQQHPNKTEFSCIQGV